MLTPHAGSGGIKVAQKEGSTWGSSSSELAPPPPGQVSFPNIPKHVDKLLHSHAVTTEPYGTHEVFETQVTF